MRTRSWARRSFARENLINGIKTMGWVIPLTILIWIYAEREQLVTATVTIHVEPRNGDRGRVITFDNASGPRVMSIRADLTGPHGRVEQVQKMLESAEAVLQLDVGSNLVPGATHPVTVQPLGNDQLFVTNGITVTNMLPRELIVYVDPVVTREVDVKPPPDVAKTIDKVTFEPRRVTVSAPQSYFNRHPALEAQADLRVDALPGPNETVAVAVPERNGNSDITLTPATV
ncbi:MAG TPA: hypothetical protein VH370_26530, partial [Humisphaera sp.]|nr:hypothetical protein [Humisphaera sp.]